MHFLFFAAPFEFMTRFPTMILYFRVCTVFTAGPNIKWDVFGQSRCLGPGSYHPRRILFFHRNFQ